MSEEQNTPEDAGDDWAAAMAEQGDAEATEAEDMQQAPMNNLVDDSNKEDGGVKLESLLDIPVSLSVKIGETRISIRNLLQLNQGSVVELDRMAGEPLDVLINNTLIAHGEVVVVNEKYGIRLTDVISAEERVKKLQ